MIPDEQLDQTLSDQDVYQTLQNNAQKLARQVLFLEEDTLNTEKLEELKGLAKNLIPKKWMKESF